MFSIRSDYDLGGVGDALAALRNRVETASSDTPLAIDLTEGRPTAVALQLAASAARSLARKSAFAGFGKTAAQILPPPTDR